MEKARSLAGDWRLVQVVLRQDVLAADVVSKEHVFDTRFLEASQLHALVPRDTETGIWVDSARIHPPQDAWASWALQVNDSWRFPAYRVGK